MKKFKKWPGPKPLPLLGTLFHSYIIEKLGTTKEVLYGGVKWVRHMSKKHGKVFVAWTFSEPLIFICDPAVIRFLSADTERVIKVGSRKFLSDNSRATAIEILCHVLLACLF